MRILILISLISLSSTALASEWKVIAETTNCPKNVKILAKQGEKYVKAVMNGQEKKLQHNQGEVFNQDAPRAATFESSGEGLHDLPTMTFTNPGMVESNVPKLDIAYSGVKHHCNMKTK